MVCSLIRSTGRRPVPCIRSQPDAAEAHRLPDGTRNAGRLRLLAVRGPAATAGPVAKRPARRPSPVPHEATPVRRSTNPSPRAAILAGIICDASAGGISGRSAAHAPGSGLAGQPPDGPAGPPRAHSREPLHCFDGRRGGSSGTGLRAADRGQPPRRGEASRRKQRLQQRHCRHVEVVTGGFGGFGASLLALHRWPFSTCCSSP